MSKSKFRGTRRDDCRLGFEDGVLKGLEEGRGEARDAFWCGFCAALATWPLAAIAYVLWRIL